MSELYQLKNISFSYPNAKVLREISLDISAGEFVGIIGPNGSGKTTLLKLLNRILSPEAGELFYKGKQLARVNQKTLSSEIGFVAQENAINFPYTVSEVVMMGRYPYMGMMGFESGRDASIVSESLKTTDMEPLANRYYTELSGGEKKRTVIARALAQSPETLLLDEPAAALDIKHEIGVYELLKKLNEEKNLNVILVTHHVNFAAIYCSRLIVLKDGKIHAMGKAQDIINPELISDVYGVEVEIKHDDSFGTPYLMPKRG